MAEKDNEWKGPGKALSGDITLEEDREPADWTSWEVEPWDTEPEEPEQTGKGLMDTEPWDTETDGAGTADGSGRTAAGSGRAAAGSGRAAAGSGRAAAGSRKSSGGPVAPAGGAQAAATVPDGDGRTAGGADGAKEQDAAKGAEAAKSAADGKDPEEAKGLRKIKSPMSGPTGWKREVWEWVKIIVTAALIALFLTSCIIANSEVPSGSMENTIMTGDRVIGSRLSYKFSDPERGDIVIFHFPDNESLYYVKRIIGLPGDTVDIVDGHVYLNGSQEPLDEPYIREPMIPEEPMHFEVPEDSYFMLGDNRNYSADSRKWQNKYVKREKIIAKVLFRYFPNPGKIE
mgnify:CR=1 FL=1